MQNRNQLQLKAGVSLKEAHDAEMEFFRDHPVFKQVLLLLSLLVAIMNGVVALIFQLWLQ